MISDVATILASAWSPEGRCSAWVAELWLTPGLMRAQRIVGGGVEMVNLFG